MSISDKYLNDLQNGIQKNIKIEKDLEKRLHRAQVTNQTELFPESIYVNMNKMNSIFFNRKSTSIIFTSTRLLEEIYVYNNTLSDLFKVSESTKISCKNVKSFVLSDMNNNIDVLLL